MHEYFVVPGEGIHDANRLLSCRCNQLACRYGKKERDPLGKTTEVGEVYIDSPFASFTYHYDVGYPFWVL